MRYVCGFMFNIQLAQVALIRKNRPAWQLGKLNGVGGKIEQGETPEFAMSREFAEETTFIHTNWQKFATLGGQIDRNTGDDRPWLIHFFRAFVSIDLLSLEHATRGQSEKVIVRHIHSKNGLTTPSECVPNLRWLIPMALNIDHDYADCFHISETY